jgi:hypothetical protein
MIVQNNSIEKRVSSIVLFYTYYLPIPQKLSTSQRRAGDLIAGSNGRYGNIAAGIIIPGQLYF